MSERRPLSKKLRFEVFKRDSFTCQYCGAKAPDVVLQCDHVNPVSKGGDNDILNLITSCAACNSGKGARKLDDHQEVERQRLQLEELNERRQQIEWMLEWRNELSKLNDDVLDKVTNFWSQKAHGYSVNENGRQLLAKWIDRFELSLLLEAVETSARQYIEFRDDEPTSESVNHAFDMIPRVAGGIKRNAEKPWLKDIYYIRAILRNRLSYINEHQAASLMEKAITACFMDTDELRNFAKEVRSWTQFRDGVQSYIDDFEAQS